MSADVFDHYLGLKKSSLLGKMTLVTFTINAAVAIYALVSISSFKSSFKLNINTTHSGHFQQKTMHQKTTGTAVYFISMFNYLHKQ